MEDVAESVKVLHRERPWPLSMSVLRRILFAMLAAGIWGFNSGAEGLPTPTAPIIFIHGLYGGSSAWQAFGDYLGANGWRFGGTPRVDAGTRRISGLKGVGDYYLMEFSDSKNLGFEQQAAELGEVIKTVLKANRAAQVILVGHSMGGLAARQYLEFHSGGTDVAVLVTVGTPHGGADISPWADSLFGLGAVSVGVQELMPDSRSMLMLNGQVKRLPRAAKYTSIVGIGTAVTPGDQDGDGVVTTQSQNLASLAGTGDLKHEEKKVFIQRRGQCDPSRVLHLQTHTCETVDPGVWALIFAAARQGEEKPGSQVVQANSPPKSAASQAAAPSSPELTFRMKDGSTVSGQLQGASIKVKSSVGVATVPVTDIASFSEGQLRLKDGSVLKGDLAVSSLAVASKYGTLQLNAKDIVWFGVGTPPAAVAGAPTPSPQVAAAKPPATGTQAPGPSAPPPPAKPSADPQTGASSLEDCEREGALAMKAMVEASYKYPDRLTLADEVFFWDSPFDPVKVGGQAAYEQRLRTYFGGWDKCVSWSQGVVRRLLKRGEASSGGRSAPGPSAALPPGSSGGARQIIKVQFVNESSGPVRLQITGNNKIEIGGRSWVTIDPGKSDEIPVMIGQQKLRVEKVRTAGPVLLWSGFRREKTVEIAPDKSVQIRDDDFK